MNNKGLSPVIAAILLIAVTVAISLAVAAWMGAITFTWMGTRAEDISFSNNYSNQSRILSQHNLTIVQANDFDATYYIEYGDFDAFLLVTQEYNISFVATDHQPYPYPRHMQKDTLYFLGNYRFWFFIELNEVGKTAVTYCGSETAWLKGD